MSSLVACRMCLTVDTRMCTIANTPLQEIYERITNLPLQSNDGRPVMACYICHHLLKKCHNFIKMSIESEELLKLILENGLELTESCLSAVNTRTHHPCLSVVYPESYSINEKLESTAVKNELKTEIENDDLEEFESTDFPGPDQIYNPSHYEDDDGGNSLYKGGFNRGTDVTLDLERELNDITEKCDDTNTEGRPKHHSEEKKPQKTSNYKNTKKQKIHKTYKCIHCDEVFEQESLLKTHLNTHSIRYQCEFCTKMFTFKNNLDRHRKSHGSHQKLHQCDQCEKAFQRKSHLKTHLLSHTGEKPYQCKICGKKFSLKVNLNCHMAIHTGERKFHCNDCGKTFNRKGNLAVHMVTHTGEKQHSCGLCGKSFSYAFMLKNHMKKVHS